jgi:2-dehydro-3-deoxygluconokinase
MRIAFFGELLLRLSTPGRQLVLQSPSFDAFVGGAEANVAVGLASLGHQTSMISAVPKGSIGDAALREIRKHGIDCGKVARSGNRLGLYFLTPGAGLRSSEVIYDRAGSSFADTLPEKWDWPQLLAGCDHLHLSGITPALGDGPARAAIAAAEYARSVGIKISFDGNYRARLWEAWDSDPRSVLNHLVGHADILFGNHKDMSLLLDRTFPGSGPVQRRAAAEAAFDAFPNLSVMASTARHIEDADRHRIAGRVDTRDEFAQTDEVIVSGIIDRIGAGDAFAAGVLHGLFGGASIADAAESGLALTCLKHSLPGDAAMFSEEDIVAFKEGTSDVRR